MSKIVVGAHNAAHLPTQLIRRNAMYEISVTDHFAAAHNLRGHKGGCENLHGHNWRVEAILTAENLDGLGMVCDFRDAKRALSGIIEEYDHCYLNELEQFRQSNPTTENISRFIAEALGDKLPEGVRVRSVAVWESESSYARYIVPEPIA